VQVSGDGTMLPRLRAMPTLAATCGIADLIFSGPVAPTCDMRPKAGQIHETGVAPCRHRYRGASVIVADITSASPCMATQAMLGELIDLSKGIIGPFSWGHRALPYRRFRIGRSALFLLFKGVVRCRDRTDPPADRPAVADFGGVGISGVTGRKAP